MKIRHYDEAEATARAIIEEVFVQGTADGALSVAVSGGSTPRMLFELMASEEYRTRIAWENLHLYWVDERCVPPTDPQSNYGMTRAALLDHVPMPVDQIYRIEGERQPEKEAIRYTELVQTHLPHVGKLPQLDVVILGIGDDGHTSSIFPHQMRLLEVQTPYVVAQSPAGQWRVCMTGPTILAARRVLFHAVGAGKRTILQQIHSGAPESLAYPSSYFVREREDIELFTDQRLD